MDWYYATAGGQGHGPVPAARLRELAATGEIGPATLVWREGMAQWQPLAQVASELGLPGFGASPPPPLPPAAAAGPYAPPQAWDSARPAPVVQPVPTYLAWAILTTLLCCWPLGVVSIVHACKVDRRRAEGDLAGALEASRKARLWALWSALSVLIALAAFVFLSVLGELLG